jgi:hypothetical protein
MLFRLMVGLAGLVGLILSAGKKYTHKNVIITDTKKTPHQGPPGPPAPPHYDENTFVFEEDFIV